MATTDEMKNALQTSATKATKQTAQKPKKQGKTESQKTANAAKKGSAAASGKGDDDIVETAYTLLDEYITAYKQEWTRLDDNERLYRGDYWDNEPKSDNEDDPLPFTPVLQSSVEYVVADLMDNYPEAIIRPESPIDQPVARVVDALIRQNHDAMNYRKEYKKCGHDLVLSGYCVQEVGYDAYANRNIGSAFIRYVDQRNILIDPQSDNLQDSRAVFKIQAKTIAWLEKRYPEYEGQFAKDQYDLQEDTVLTFDQAKSLLMIEYWWKEWDVANDRWMVHMAKMAGRVLLEDSRTVKPEGYFAFGEYPFVITTLFRRKGSALGLGFADMFGPEQKYADKLDQIVLRNAQMSSHNKLLVTEASGFDVEDLKDWAKEVHRGESLNGITWFQTPPLPDHIVMMANQIRNGIKEESGANDFSRGQTNHGVTAASAIASMQDAASKRSRVIADQMHEAFKEAVRYEIEIEREFNALPREVLVTVDGQQQQETFESALMTRETGSGNDLPVEFYVSIKVQKESRWAVQAHNELMLEMVRNQMLMPNEALELMEFEGKETLLSKQQQRQQQAQTSQEPTPEEQQAGQQAQEQMQMQDEIAALPTPDSFGGRS